jgi:hypothetical protein
MGKPIGRGNMNMRMKGIKFAFILFLVGLYTFISAQTVTDDFRPFVRLGYELILEVYQNPVISDNRIVDRGKLIERKMVPFALGSGTVISPEGLILTNYHVYNFPGSQEYDQDANQMIIYGPASKDMMVYELSDNDPLKAPVIKYVASPLAYDEQLDICVLKIIANYQTGDEITRTDFPYIELGNPFNIAFNANLSIVGYPAKGGDTLTLTEGKFLGYTRNVPYVVEGSIKTNATMAGGSSGGSALHNNKLIGLPTRGSPKEQKGFDFGYIHPVTWAVGSLALSKMMYGVSIPEIPGDWVASDYNVAITKSDIFIGGKIYSAQSNMPVDKAQVLIHRSDRTLNQIVQLDKEIQVLTMIVNIQTLYQQGVSKAEIAASLKMSQAEVSKVLTIDTPTLEFSSDARKWLNGEFFYQHNETNEYGFFFTSVPRGQDLTLYVEKSGFRQLRRNVSSGAGLYQDLGQVRIFAY